METKPQEKEPPEVKVADYISMLGPCEQWWIEDDTASYPIFGDEMLGADF